MLLNSVVVFVHWRSSFRTLPLPKYKKNAPTIIYALSERWTRLSRDTDFSFTIEPMRRAAPHRTDSRLQRTRDDKSSPARSRRRTHERFINGPRKNQEATLGSFAKHHGFFPQRTHGLLADHLPLPCAKDFSL